MRSLQQRGVTLLDVLVGSALVLIIFLGLFAIIRASLAVSTVARLKNTATAIATTQMEYIRSLAYGSTGTVGGIPAGLVPQYATTTDSGVAFVTRTYIEYADDAADGLDTSDSNGIITDYKHLKVSTTYIANGTLRDITLVSNMAPPGIETTTGGGTLRITAVNASGAPVSGASVRIVNTSTAPSVDVTTFSDASGIVYLPGAATSTEYQIYVSKSGYSSAQTYTRDVANPNPTPGYLTVAENQTTTSTFAIDVLASLTLRTFSPIAPGIFADVFNSSTNVESLSNTSVSGSALVLTGAPGTYPASGSARATTTAPSYLVAWENASSTLSTPLGTDAHLFVVDGSGALLPDAVLAGNSAGFTGTIDLSGISTTTYPALALRAELTSMDVNVTPSVLDWGLGYTTGPAPLPNVSFTLTGAKTIGTDASSASIFKTIVATSTDSDGVRTLPLEWDLYQLSIPGYTVVSGSPEAPYELLPSTSVDATLILTP